LVSKDALKWVFNVYVRVVSVLSNQLAGHGIHHARLHIQRGYVKDWRCAYMVQHVAHLVQTGERMLCVCIDSAQHDAAKQAHVQVVLASNLTKNTGYLDRIFMVFRIVDGAWIGEWIY
jgi:hypothetical protein